jgi:DHA3 family macrolide efflux protein-like MFS transporter
MATIVGILPQIILGPVAGALVDRGNRRVIMMLADGLVAGATAILAVLFILGAVQTWQVYLVLCVRAVAGCFHWPAMAASTSLMVPKQHLSRVQGANQTLNGGLSIVTAPLAALLLDRFPLQVILGIDIATALLAIIAYLHQSASHPDHPPGKPAPDLLLGGMRGFQYVGKWLA